MSQRLKDHQTPLLAYLNDLGAEFGHLQTELQAFSSVYPPFLTKRRELSHDAPFWEGKNGDQTDRTRKKTGQEASPTEKTTNKPTQKKYE
jgi:hypothetical protein